MRPSARWRPPSDATLTNAASLGSPVGVASPASPSCVVVVRGPEAGMATAEGVLERVVQHGCTHVEEGRYGRVLSAFAPASIAWAESKPIHGQAASTRVPPSTRRDTASRASSSSSSAARRRPGRTRLRASWRPRGGRSCWRPGSTGSSATATSAASSTTGRSRRSRARATWPRAAPRRGTRARAARRDALAAGRRRRQPRRERQRWLAVP